MNKITVDDVLWEMIDICLRLHDLSKKHPDYSYAKGVGMTYNPKEDADLIEYCRLVDKYKKLRELGETMDRKYLLAEYYFGGKY